MVALVEQHMPDSLVCGLVTASNGMGRAGQMLTDERKRVDDLLARTVADRRAENLRQEAAIRVANGGSGSAQDAAIGPTPEQLARAEYRETPAKRDGDWSDAQVRTVRRVMATSPIQKLWGAGTLSDEQYAAGLWYHAIWNKAGFDSPVRVSQFDPVIQGGDKLYGHLAHFEWQVEARMDYLYFYKIIPPTLVKAVELVVIHELTICDTARQLSRRKGWVTPALKLGLGYLYEALAARIDVRAIINA